MSDDFGFYGEEDDNPEVEDLHGMTDKVSEFTFTNLEYPCIVFKEGFTCKNHKWRIIANMVKAIDSSKDTALYYRDNGGLVKMGMLSGRQIESFLDLVGLENVSAFYDENTTLTGGKIYSLCVF